MKAGVLGEALQWLARGLPIEAGADSMSIKSPMHVFSPLRLKT
jgi:hypothetical protein